ncbi:hypothetical protein ACYZTM_29195 [Pseudomonas sp. MDT2-39-1]
MNAIVEKAKLSRQNVLLSRYRKSDGVFADPPPAVTITEQTLLPDLRIPVAKLTAPLEYTIPQPTDPEDADDEYEVEIRKKGATAWEKLVPLTLLGPIANRVWPLKLYIPVTHLVEDRDPETPTEYEVRYIYLYAGANPGTSLIATYAIDRTAPYRIKEPASNRSPGAASFPIDLPPAAPIDEEYIGNNPTGITIKAASYGTAYLPTDRIKVFWGAAPDVERDPPVFEDLLPSTYEVTIPINVFVNSAEGYNVCVYVVTDAAGNISKKSSPSSREIRRLTDPTVFAKPVVPLANGEDGDGLIDLADCALGVDAVIDVPTPNAGSDTIQVFWGIESLGEKRVDQSVGGKLTWEGVDFAIIKKVYGDTDGDEKTNISYAMFRGARHIGGNNDDINVNIYYPGPTNPNEPDPVNPVLTAPTLETEDGSTDEILESDFGKDATITFTLFTLPVTQEGWFIKILYGTAQVGDVIRLSPGQEGTEITRTLPWETIFEQNSGTKILRWELSALDNPNPVVSTPKNIPVADFPIQTPMPQVQGLQGSARRISCPTLNFIPPGDGTNRRNLAVIIPKSTYTVDGETITLSYAAYTNTNPPILVPGTETTADLLISGVFPNEGSLIHIGVYEDHFKPANRANAVLSYTITRTGTTDTPPSAEAIHEIVLTNGSGQYCEEANPIPSP